LESHVIGIEFSKATLDCAYLRDPDQDKAKRKSCQNKLGCFESLVAWVETLSGVPRQSLAFVIEPTNVYHEQPVQFLHSKGTTVYLVNPGRVWKFAEGIGILSKSAY
jgi:transposase